MVRQDRSKMGRLYSMKISRIAKPLLATSLLFAGNAALASEQAGDTAETEAVTAKITGTSFLTDDAEKSAAFYVDFLGFKILRDSTTQSEATRAVYGLLAQESVRIILVVPSIWSREDPNHLGIAFAEIAGDADHPFPSNVSRLPRKGEPTIGFEVTGLVQIIERMEAAGIPTVVPLAPSATGRSQAVTVLDPNGMRIQLYEYINSDAE